MTDELRALASQCPSGPEILKECEDLAKMLLEKNAAYGDSALTPIQMFARGIPADAQIRVRLDDKLSRLALGHAAGEDVECDLIGYLVLLRVWRIRNATPQAVQTASITADLSHT